MGSQLWTKGCPRGRWSSSALCGKRCCGGEVLQTSSTASKEENFHWKTAGPPRGTEGTAKRGIVKPYWTNCLVRNAQEAGTLRRFISSRFDSMMHGS